MSNTERDEVLKAIDAVKAEIDNIYETIGSLNDEIECQKANQRKAQAELSDLIRKLSDLSR